MHKVRNTLQVQQACELLENGIFNSLLPFTNIYFYFDVELKSRGAS